MKNKSDNNKELLLGMSGGVDSTSAALIAIRDGFSVKGVTHVMTEDGFAEAENAKKACLSMNIRHETVDLRNEFKRNVIEYFVDTYKAGKTPNPCIVCNKTIKFPYLFSMSDSAYVATGHYARIERCGDSFLLKKGLDAKKDQSYMLWALPKEYLSRLVFPLGSMTKEQVRLIASDFGLEAAVKKDSQDICFIPDGDHISFMKEFLRCDAFPSGSYVDGSGKILGSHSGHMCYTPGQSRGLGIALGKKMFVVSKDPVTNTVVLGSKSDVMKRELTASKINLLADCTFETPQRFEAKVRYSAPAAPCTVFRSGEDTLSVTFDLPVPAAAPGQSLVIYDGDTVIAGGEID